MQSPRSWDQLPVGTDHLNTFLFEHTSNNELTVAQYELDHLDEVSALIEALRGASGDITVSYFTTTVLFSADSVADALAQMDNDCLPF